MHPSINKGLLPGFVFAACLASHAAWAETAYIDFNGKINPPTCSLQTSSITIPIGDVDKSTFTAVGSESAYSPNVPLVSAGCNASLVSMTFTGRADPDNPALFAVSGGAKGVGIRLAKYDGTAFAAPNDTSKPITFVPEPAGQGYSFKARYEQTLGSVTTGPANATITVLITYI